MKPEITEKKDPRKYSRPEFRKLTELEEAFVDAYVGEANFDAVKAYSLAGYAYSSRPFTDAANVLRRVHVIRAIREALESSAKYQWITEDVIIQRLWKEATNDKKGSTQAARINALVWIGKHLGMWQERKEETGDKKPEIQIVNYQIPRDQLEKELTRPEVEKVAQKNNLPEGVVIHDYDSDKLN